MVINMLPNDSFLSPSENAFSGNKTVVLCFFKALGRFLAIHTELIYRLINMEESDLITNTCYMLTYLMKNKSRYIDKTGSETEIGIDLDDFVNSVLKCAKKKLLDEYPSFWPLNGKISEDLYQRVSKYNIASN